MSWGQFVTMSQNMSQWQSQNPPAPQVSTPAPPAPRVNTPVPPTPPPPFLPPGVAKAPPPSTAHVSGPFGPLAQYHKPVPDVNSNHAPQPANPSPTVPATPASAGTTVNPCDTPFSLGRLLDGDGEEESAPQQKRPVESRRSRSSPVRSPTSSRRHRSSPVKSRQADKENRAHRSSRSRSRRYPSRSRSTSARVRKSHRESKSKSHRRSRSLGSRSRSRRDRRQSRRSSRWLSESPVRSPKHQLTRRPKPKSWQSDKLNHDSQAPYGLPLPKAVVSSKFTQAVGGNNLAGQDSLDVRLVDVIFQNGESCDLRYIAPGRWCTVKLLRSQNELHLVNQILKGVRWSKESGQPIVKLDDVVTASLQHVNMSVKPTEYAERAKLWSYVVQQIVDKLQEITGVNHYNANAALTKQNNALRDQIAALQRQVQEGQAATPSPPAAPQVPKAPPVTPTSQPASSSQSYDFSSQMQSMQAMQANIMQSMQAYQAMQSPQSQASTPGPRPPTDPQASHSVDRDGFAIPAIPHGRQPASQPPTNMESQWMAWQPLLWNNRGHEATLVTAGAPKVTSTDVKKVAGHFSLSRATATTIKDVAPRLALELNDERLSTAEAKKRLGELKGWAVTWGLPYTSLPAAAAGVIFPDQVWDPTESWGSQKAQKHITYVSRIFLHIIRTMTVKGGYPQEFFRFCYWIFGLCFLRIVERSREKRYESFRNWFRHLKVSSKTYSLVHVMYPITVYIRVSTLHRPYYIGYTVCSLTVRELTRVRTFKCTVKGNVEPAIQWWRAQGSFWDYAPIAVMLCPSKLAALVQEHVWIKHRCPQLNAPWVNPLLQKIGVKTFGHILRGQSHDHGEHFRLLQRRRRLLGPGIPGFHFTPRQWNGQSPEVKLYSTLYALSNTKVSTWPLQKDIFNYASRHELYLLFRASRTMTEPEQGVTASKLRVIMKKRGFPVPSISVPLKVIGLPFGEYPFAIENLVRGLVQRVKSACLPFFVPSVGVIQRSARSISSLAHNFQSLQKEPRIHRQCICGHLCQFSSRVSQNGHTVVIASHASQDLPMAVSRVLRTNTNEVPLPPPKAIVTEFEQDLANFFVASNISLGPLGTVQQQSYAISCLLESFSRAVRDLIHSSGIQFVLQKGVKEFTAFFTYQSFAPVFHCIDKKAGVMAVYCPVGYQLSLINTWFGQQAQKVFQVTELSVDAAATLPFQALHPTVVKGCKWAFRGVKLDTLGLPGSFHMVREKKDLSDGRGIITFASAWQSKLHGGYGRVVRHMIGVVVGDLTFDKGSTQSAIASVKHHFRRIASECQAIQESDPEAAVQLITDGLPGFFNSVPQATIFSICHCQARGW